MPTGDSIQCASHPPNGYAVSVIGRRPEHEDCHVYATWKRGSDVFELVATLDGHSGIAAAEFAKRNLPRAIARHLTAHNARHDERAAATEIATAFLSVQQAMERSTNRKLYETSGTTACVAIKCCGGKKLIVANCGDSRALLVRSGRAMALSTDHKPASPSEKKRIEALGAHISHNKNDVPRVRELGLSVSRGLGDLESRIRGQPGVYIISPLPDVVAVDLAKETDTHIIVECDGITESLQNHDVARIATSPTAARDPKLISERVVQSAYNRGSGDNLTCITWLV